MNIWKVGTNWDGGNITDIFLRNHVVFFHPGDRSSADDIRQGDLVAIACGHSIVAVAMAVAQPGRLAGQPGFYLTAKDQERINGCVEDIVGVRVQWLPDTLLRGSRVIWYASRTRFHAINKAEVRRSVTDVWNWANRNATANPFRIDARTSTLGGLLSGGRTLLYQIPIFQREYSWGSSEVERFLRDLLGSYYKEECMFAGTMQLSGPRLFNHHGGCFQEVIDGQQRLTTAFLILKALHLHDPRNERVGKLLNGDRDWLETKVNSGSQQKALDEVMQEEAIPQPVDLGLSRFRDNLLQIHSFLKGELDPGGAESGDRNREFDLRAFAEHFLDGVQFVVIETEAGLSKTIQIFNVINTTGLDLNGGDLFKVRMFEYLTDRHGAPNRCFEEISRVYERIEAENTDRRRTFTSIHEILGIYQRLLCARHDLPLGLVRAGTETFYERLFDTLLGNKVWADYRTTAELDRQGAPLLELEDIGKLITLRHAADAEWHASGEMSRRNRLARHLIHWSRYPSYWVLVILADYRYVEEIKVEPELREDFSVALARLCVVYSVAYAKQINEIHGFFAEVSSGMFRRREPESQRPGRSLRDTIACLNAKGAACREDFHREISGYLASYLTAKHLVCRLVEALHGGEDADLDGIFEEGYDIEHIRSYTDEDAEKVDVVRREWGVKLHNLGNLMLLQYGLNRSMKNQSFRAKLGCYRESKLRVALGITTQYAAATEWGMDAAAEKLDHGSKLLDGYLFG